MARERWPSRMLFIFAAVGSAAGLGNLWRFPYMAYEYGGGAFLIPYFVALLILGIPMLLLEFGLGRTFQKSAVGALQRIKPWAGTIGWWALGIGFMILSYYAVVMAWSLKYLVSSPQVAWAASAKDFFFGNILGISDGIGILGGMNWGLLVALIVVWALIYFSIWKGVHSVSKVVAITVPLPVILILVMLIRTVTLDGAGAGLAAYVTPTLSAIWDPQVWIAAAGQIFFTLTLSFGVMIAYASYTKKSEDTASDTIWTALLNSSISILAGFVVFATLGFLAMQSGSLVSDVVAGGPGLAFVVFPEALAQMPAAGLFSVLFFLVLLSLGIDSAFSLIEGFTAAFKEKLTASTATISFWACALCFAAGLIYVTGAGLYFLDVIDHFTNNYGLILVGLATALVVGWSKNGEQVKALVAKNSPWFPTNLWWNNIKFVVPLVLAVLLIASFLKEIAAPYEGYPQWAITMGWLAVFVPLVVGWFLNKWYAKA